MEFFHIQNLNMRPLIDSEVNVHTNIKRQLVLRIINFMHLEYHICECNASDLLICHLWMFFY